MARKKRRYSARDQLTASLVLVVVLGMVLMGGIGLYMTGIFDPVEATVALADTEPLNLPTQPPRSLLDWLFPTARAEEESETRSASELEALLEDIVAEERGEEEIAAEDRVTVEKGDLALNQNLPDDWLNVLLMGTDSRDVNAKTGRTDVMIIASVNLKTGEIKLSSLARDMYVPIPNGVGENRINAAHAFGGPELALKTVNQNFEMNIQDYALVNFAGMASIVDAVGGVDIELVGEEWFWINYGVALGEDYEGFAKSDARRLLTEEDMDTVVHLDGLQAVAYARIRKMDNDLQRASRQRILLQAIMEKAMASKSTLVNVALSMLPYVNTNMTPNRIMQLVLQFLAADSFSFTEMSIPVEGTYRNETVNEMQVITFDQAQNNQAMHNFIYGAYYPASDTAQ